MKRPLKTSYLSLMFVLLVSLLMAAGCAAPQTSTGVQQRIEELLKIQRQQAQQLTQLQQQLASLQGQPHAPLIAPGQPADQERPAAVKNTQPLRLPAPPSTAETAEVSAAAQLYLEAFAAIATGQMPEAESGFKAFIQRFPEHKYSGNANYWLAEALMAQQKEQRAINVLRAIIENPQQQNKAPAAMARLVNYYRANDAADKAADILQILSTKYPASPEFKRLMRVNETR